MTPHSSGSAFSSKSGTCPFPSELGALVHKKRGIAAIIDDEVRPRAIRPLQRLGGAPPILLERLPFPRENGMPFGSSAVPPVSGRPTTTACRGVVLRRKDVAADPANVRAEVRQCLDENAGLHGHVQRAMTRAPVSGSTAHTFPGKPSAGHFMLGKPHLGPTEGSQTQIPNLNGSRPAALAASNECVTSSVAVMRLVLLLRKMRGTTRRPAAVGRGL